MSAIIVAAVIYAFVFGADYWFYVKQKPHYNYVSWRTLGLFTAGIVVHTLLFNALLKPYFANWITELVFIVVLLAVLVAVVFVLTSSHKIQCTLPSRTEQSLTPQYMVVKLSEIVFQQLSYLVIGLGVVSLIGFNILGTLLFIHVLILLHTPVILSCNREVIYKLGFGLAVIAAPMLYIFIELSYVFPAIYLHGLLYVAYWAYFSQFVLDTPPKSNPGITTGIGG